MSWQERISVCPGVLVGKPATKGTRIAAWFLVQLLAWFGTHDFSPYRRTRTPDSRIVRGVTSALAMPRDANAKQRLAADHIVSAGHLLA